MSKTGRIRYKIALVLYLILGAHLLLFGCMLGSTRIYSFFSFPAAGQYKMNLVLGPFFDEGRIQATCKLQYRTKNNNDWSEWHIPEDDNFTAYHNNYLRYDLLKKNQLESSMAYLLFLEMDKDSTFSHTDKPAYINLKRYLEDQYIHSKPDSIELAYICYNEFENDLSRRQDSIYHILDTYE